VNGEFGSSKLTHSLFTIDYSPRNGKFAAMSLELEQLHMKERFLELFEKNEFAELREFLDEQNISDVAELVDEMPEFSHVVVGNMSLHRAASVFKILETSIQKDTIRHLAPAKTAELLNELPADDRTAFLEELPSEVVKELIRLLNPQERKVTLSLLGYPEGSVGRLMTPDYIAVQVDWTVAEVLAHIRQVGKEMETIDVIYVVTDKGEFVDDIRIRDIILA